MVSVGALDECRHDSALTLDLKLRTSSSVNVSALAMTGIRLTLVCRRRITSMSRGLREWPVG